MPSVDDFAQFVAEELAKDGHSCLMILAPTSADAREEPEWAVWSLGALERLTGQDLSATLNKASQKLDYTYKNIRSTDEGSLLCKTASAAERWESYLMLVPPSDSPLWTVKASQVGYDFQALTLREALQTAFDFMEDIGYPNEHD